MFKKFGFFVVKASTLRLFRGRIRVTSIVQLGAAVFMLIAVSGGGPAGSARATTSNAVAMAPPAEEPPVNQGPITEPPVGDGPAAGGGGNETPSDDGPATSAPSNDGPITDLPTNNDPVTDSPTNNAPSGDGPAANTPSDETPTFDAPVTDLPGGNIPSGDGPASDNPSSDGIPDLTPGDDGPVTGVPGEDLPLGDGPAAGGATEDGLFGGDEGPVSTEAAEEAAVAVMDQIADLPPAEAAAYITDSVIDAFTDLEPVEAAAFVGGLIDAIVPDDYAGELTVEQQAQLDAALDTVFEEGVSAEMAETLAGNEAVLASVDADQAEQIFESIDAGGLTDEVAEQIVGAVQDADEEVRDTFEDTVDLFEGAFDDYEMLDQTINVGDRRTVIAVNVAGAASSAIAAAGAMPGRAAPSPAPSSSSSSSSSQREGVSRREEQQGEGEIDGEVKNSNLSKYKYVNGEKVLDWKSFSKKFAQGFFNMGFTVAGGVVLFFTVSGTLRWVTGIAFASAATMSMVMHMSESDN